MSIKGTIPRKKSCQQLEIPVTETPANPGTYRGRSPLIVPRPASVLSYLTRAMISSLLPSWFPLWRTCLINHRKVQKVREVAAPFLTSLSAFSLPSKPTWRGTDRRVILLLLTKSFSFLRHSHSILELITGDLRALMAAWLSEMITMFQPL